MKSRAVLGLAALAAAMPVHSGHAQPVSIRDWDLVCFCNSRTHTPPFVIQMDNNGAILYAARAGITRAGLRHAGLRASESQLQLLLDWSLLSDSGGTLRTSFPVLPPALTGRLRAGLRTTARAGLPGIRPRLDTLVSLIASRADSAAAWAAVFSYVLDGLVWDSLAPVTDLVPSDITVTRSYWNGGFWAIAPKRAQAPGTNAARLDSTTVVQMTWTPATLARFKPLESPERRAELSRALREHDPSHLPADVAALGLLRSDGSPAVVVIHERQPEPLVLTARALAGEIARDFTASMGRLNFAGEIGVRDEGLATLIAYHEYMWELLDALVGGAILPVPPAVRDHHAPPSEARRLITLVIR